ncbi:MAG TPA: tetratricopeptide repeat protein [Gemmatales bacterium]|nr:tetratricopeptide repeat protein [Gemmatales bacterium]
MYPENASISSPEIEQHFHEAETALREGNPLLARQHFFQALAISPEAPNVHHGLATCCFLLSDLNGAVYHFQEVLRQDPTRIGAAINLGAVYNQMGRPDDALNVLRQSIKQDPKRAEAYYNMGLAYRLKGQVELAIQSYKEALHHDARMMDAHFNLGNLLHELGRDSQAVRCYQMALELKPDFEPAIHGLQAAQAALQELQHPKTPVMGLNVAGSSAVNRSLKPTVDVHQPLDPNIDGTGLAAVHRATITSENSAREMLHVIEADLEPAIHDLSSRLLDSKADKRELMDYLEKFEVAMNKTRAVQRSWQQTMQQIRDTTDKLMQPHTQATAS